MCKRRFLVRPPPVRRVYLACGSHYPLYVYKQCYMIQILCGSRMSRQHRIDSFCFVFSSSKPRSSLLRRNSASIDQVKRHRTFAGKVSLDFEQGFTHLPVFFPPTARPPARPPHQPPHQLWGAVFSCCFARPPIIISAYQLNKMFFSLPPIYLF